MSRKGKFTLAAFLTLAGAGVFTPWTHWDQRECSVPASERSTLSFHLLQRLSVKPSHYGSWNLTLGLLAFAVTTHLLQLPLFFQFNTACRASDRAAALRVGLAIGFTELVPLVWAIANASSWMAAFHADERALGHAAWIIFWLYAALWTVIGLFGGPADKRGEPPLGCVAVLPGMLLGLVFTRALTIPFKLLQWVSLINGPGARIGWFLFCVATLPLMIFIAAGKARIRRWKSR